MVSLEKVDGDSTLENSEHRNCCLLYTSGLINPVAVFEPVELEGTTVSRASVHNISIMEELELGVGDEIQVYKANMIIPQIAENLTRLLYTSGAGVKSQQCSDYSEGNG